MLQVLADKFVLLAIEFVALAIGTRQEWQLG